MENTLNPTRQQIADFLIERIISDITGFLMEDYHFPLDKALNTIYNSSILTKLEQIEDELYIQSSLYIYELLLKEKGLYPISNTATMTIASE